VAFTLFKAFSEAKDLAMADLTETSAKNKRRSR